MSTDVFENQFESNQNQSLALRESGTVAAVAREEAELKGAIFLARQFPRNEFDAANKIVNSCKRSTFAKEARYSFPRGGKTIEGPSVDLARESARCWGNIRYGFRVVSSDEESIHLKGYAHDLETNNYAELEDKFKRKIQRKNKTTGLTEWVEPDERDTRELCNRRGAILERNCILKVIPPDVVEDAMRVVRDTLQSAASKDLKLSKHEILKTVCASFDVLGVSAAMIEQRLGHPLDLITSEELVELRAIGKSIRDGNSKREEYFSFPNASAQQVPPNDELNSKLNERKAKLKKQASDATTPTPPPAQKINWQYQIVGQDSPYRGYTLEQLREQVGLGPELDAEGLTDEDKSAIAQATIELEKN